MAIPFPGTAAPGGQLDHHLAEGYDVERAAEGWVLLRRGSARVAVTVPTRGTGKLLGLGRNFSPDRPGRR